MTTKQPEVNNSLYFVRSYTHSQPTPNMNVRPACLPSPRDLQPAPINLASVPLDTYPAPLYDEASANHNPVIALTLAYDGSYYSGFARQPGQKTVQGELEQALAVIYHREVPTVGAGRTDAGVHAHGQVVSFELATGEYEARSLQKLINSLNALTADSMVVRAAQLKDPGFSARFSAIEREYRYRIYTKDTPPMFMAPYVWWIPLQHPLDVNAMRQAAPLLLGEHDFRSFCLAKSAEGKSTTRNIRQIFIFGHQHLGENCLVIQVIGNAFLHSMVRVLVGTLVEVGLRNKPPEWVLQVLAACDRRAAGQTAPANGLTFWSVRYK